MILIQHLSCVSFLPPVLMTTGRIAHLSLISNIKGDSCHAPPPCYWVPTLFGQPAAAPRLVHLISIEARTHRGTDCIRHSDVWTWVPRSVRIPIYILDPNGISTMNVWHCVDRETDCCFYFSNHWQQLTCGHPRHYSTYRGRQTSPECPRP